MRVLIAEDDPVSRRLLEALLVKWGYEVVVTCNGEEAREVLLRPDAPSMAILDWMMPGMDGPQVCREIRKCRPEPYVYLLLLTAKAQKQDTVEGLNAGADDYLTKPFDSNELRGRLRAGQRILDLQTELLAMREALREQATHDSLTGLPNRLLFSDRLTQGLSRARRTGQQLAVMFLDLDHFKLINDTLGHKLGDALLKEAANRLTECLREVDTIARMGGDEFTMILSDISDPRDALSVAHRIQEAFKAPFMMEDNELFVTTSIGISIYPSDGDDVETLVKNADTAMYRAKEQGRNNYQLYTEALNIKAMERMTLENNLRHALERSEFFTHYQARVNLTNGKIMGTEALIRWEHPELGLIPPAQFIPLAEDTGLIVPIGRWVLQTSCMQNKQWQEAGLPPVSVAVNLSARQFRQGNLPATVREVLDETGLDPQYLELELTETTLMQNPDLAINILSQLKAMGVKISIDDFGTGHSSLSYVKRFPVDAVKIDQSFVRDITTDPDDAAIAGAVIAMAHSLNLNVIAEGVETLDQLEFLRTLKCDEMQGYFISRPVPSQEFANLLRTSQDHMPFHRLQAA